MSITNTSLHPPRTIDSISRTHGCKATDQSNPQPYFVRAVVMSGAIKTTFVFKFLTLASARLARPRRASQSLRLISCIWLMKPQREIEQLGIGRNIPGSADGVLRSRNERAWRAGKVRPAHMAQACPACATIHRKRTGKLEPMGVGQLSIFADVMST